MESEGDESPVADLRGMMIRMFNEHKEEFKENMKNNSMNVESTDEKVKKTKKQLNELKEDFIKLQSEMKIIKRIYMK
jgi:peptidoglycan hydrolase CwlO-like protein